MFIIADQLKDVNNCQCKIIETQKNHSEVRNKAVSLIRNNSRKLMACNQLFYARDQMLQVQTNLIGSLSALLNEIKSYRTAVVSCKLLILNSVMTMVNKLIPMALLPRTALEEILEAVVIWQTKENERLSLAIHTNQLLTYYETKILRNVDVVEDGMFFNLAIPFVTGATALNLYRAIPVPMPNEGTDRYASQYAIQSDFIAIAESAHKIAFLAHDEIVRCIGSSSFSVCIKGFSLETAHDTCLGSLLIGNHFIALQKCDIKTVKLPVKEKAQNIGNGKWMITSATPNLDMYLSTVRNNVPFTQIKLVGCQVCIIQLECGTKIETTYLEIRADMISCHNATITRLDISLTDPFKHLLAKIPAIDNLPHMATIAQARQQFIEDIQLKMSEVPEYQRFSSDKLDEVAEPILRDMQTVRTGLSNKFTQAHTWKISIIIGIASFIISMVLNFINYLVHKYGNRYAKLMRSEKK